VLNEKRIDVLMNGVKEKQVQGLPEASLYKSVADQNQQTTSTDQQIMQGTSADRRQQVHAVSYRVK
jgi:hypothetical protein